MKEIIMAYFQSWLDNDAEVLKDVFAEQAVYSESYGPEYHGLSQIITWFENWNNKGKVLEWTIKRIIENDKSLGSGFEIGHSYFLPKLKDDKGNKKDLEDIVQFEIIPLLEEYWYDDEDMLIKWKDNLSGYFK